MGQDGNVGGLGRVTVQVGIGMGGRVGGPGGTAVAVRVTVGTGTGGPVTGGLGPGGKGKEGTGGSSSRSFTRGVEDGLGVMRVRLVKKMGGGLATIALSSWHSK